MSRAITGLDLSRRFYSEAVRPILIERFPDVAHSAALSSRLIAARQAQRLMELCFMMERRYIPYSKWLGAAFRALPSAEPLRRPLEAALAAERWEDRQHALRRAGQAAIQAHNRLALTEPVSPRPSNFHDRPFRVVRADAVAAAIRRLVP